MSITITPYPLNTYPSSPLWQLSPITSNSSSGWVPSCTSSNCLPTASWSTGAVNSTLSYTFYAFGFNLNGTVQGDMKLQVIRNDKEESLNSSGDILFSAAGPTDQFLHQNLTIKVLEASAGARLTINGAFLNASTLADIPFPTERWTLPSNDGALKYTGFVQQQAASGLASPTTYVSSAAGDKVSMTFNASAFTIYGPCGPSSGLMRVAIDGNTPDTINTTKPIQSDDCLLYQSPGLAVDRLRSFEMENVDGRTLALNRVEYFRIITFTTGGRSTKVGGMAAGIALGVIVLIAGLVLLYSTRGRKTRQKINNSWKVFCS
ncbi:hypothetical protein FRC11_006369 [Ceratobasidium sp. 423]|nr:hypothetical protein FRC11_006369 [Ceratobasidium sp. 423]